MSNNPRISKWSPLPNSLTEKALRLNRSQDNCRSKEKDESIWCKLQDGVGTD